MKLPRLPRKGNILEAKYTTEQMREYGRKCVAQAQPISDKALIALARRTLWLAYVWNDHNFDAAHLYAKREAQQHGINSFDQAQAWLDATEIKP